MSNPFDGLRNLVVNTVANVMGFTATWQPSIGGALLTATVLYKYNTEGFTVGDNEYIPHNYMIEYNTNIFPNLKALVDDSSTKEKIVVSIDGITETILIRKVEAKFDGFTLYAFGDKK